MDALKKSICDAIDKNRDKVIEIGEHVLRNPELGYKEKKTSAYVQEVLQSLSLDVSVNHAITGVKAWLKGKNSNVNLCIIGELDAVICNQHPFADPDTGAAHSCGHNAQLAGMLGAAIGLVHSGAAEKLDGNICFFATPAEEYVEIEYRRSLAETGKISFLGGKQQLIADGDFDDIDLALMFHAINNGECPKVNLMSSSMGFIGKSIRFIGKEAHAGAYPYNGVNALNAASLAIMAINAQRETFRDSDSVRVHPIVTKGGDLVNIVPADVRMESYVRAGNIEAMISANEKVNRAVRGAAYAVGAQVDIDDMAGYLPMKQSEPLSRVFEENARLLLGDGCATYGGDFPGSTDLGDLSYVMPVIQATISGFSGDLHSKDFKIANKELAYIIPAKIMAMTAVDLLKDGAVLGKKVVNEHSRHSAGDYRKVWNELLDQKTESDI